jgi:hypothetical protein
MKQFSHLTLLTRISRAFFTALSLSLFMPIATPLYSMMHAAHEEEIPHHDRNLLEDLSKMGPQHGFTSFPVRDGGSGQRTTYQDLLDQELNHDKSPTEKLWDWYYSLNPIAQKAAPTTRMGTVWHYGQQLLASGKRKAQKFGPNQDEVAALKLGINIEWPNSTLHEQDRGCYFQEAQQSISQIQEEFKTRHTTPLSNYVSERITDLTYFLAFTVDKSKPYYQRKRILDSIQKTHAQSHLLDFDIPKLNQTGADLIPLYVKKLAKEEAAAGKKPSALRQADQTEQDDEFGISSDSDTENGDRGTGMQQNGHARQPLQSEEPEEKRQ